MHPSPSPGEPRVVLLGASNLAQGLRVVLEEARARLGAPLHAFGALGRGRSYGAHSWFLVRRMMGVRECGLWARLAELEGGVTHALVTDVGNDLPFGQRPETILEWVGEALARLECLGASCVVTGLPLANLRALSPAAFGFWRRVIFPTHALDRGALLADAERLDAGLREICARRGHVWVEPRARWYGVDPVHVARAQRRAAWREILEPWRPGPPLAQHVGRRAGWPDPLLCAPQRRWVLGFEQRREQPCARVGDGSTLWLY
jgi:hypothetical protein